jgi:VWA domain-containing protein
MRTLSKLFNRCCFLVVLLASTGAFSQNSLDLYTTAARQSRIADRMAGMERFIAAYPTSGLHEDALEFLVWDSLESGQREQSRTRATELRQLDPQNALALAIISESLSESANGNRKEIQQGFELAKSGIQSYPKLRRPEGMGDGEFIQMQREVVCILDGETGLGFLAQKDYRNARSYLRQSISIKPQDARYLYGMSLALLEERNQNSQQEGYLYLARVVNLTRGSAAGQQIAAFAQHRFEEAGGTATGWNDYLASAVVPGSPGATVVASASTPAASTQPRPQSTTAQAPATQTTQTTAAPSAAQTSPRPTTTVATATPATTAPAVTQPRPQPSTPVAAAPPSTQTSTTSTATAPATTAANQQPLYSRPINSTPAATQAQTPPATVAAQTQTRREAPATVASAAPAPRTPAVTAVPSTGSTTPGPSSTTRTASTGPATSSAPTTQTASVAPAQTAPARTPSSVPTQTASTATAQTAKAAPPVHAANSAPVQTAKAAPPVVTPAAPAPDVSSQSASKSATILQPAPELVAKLTTPAYEAAPPESIPEPTFRREYVSRTAPVSMGILLQTERLTKENRQEILAALTDMVRHLRNDDEVFIMAYGKKLNFEQDLTGNPRLLEEAMDQIKPDPGTALLDAVGFAAGHLERIATNKNRLLLVISDGRNTPSKDNPLTLSQRLNTVRVDCIGLDVGGDSARRQLESLAAYSGGQVTFASTTAQLRNAAVQMAEGIGIEFPN